jgi:predicted dehydrogenase
VKKRAAVVGVGYLGRFHAQKYKANKDVELVGVCDGNPEIALKVATELSVEAFTDAKALIGKVELVTIAASTQAHYQLGLLFLNNGVHVNLEKPLAATVSQAEELVETARRKGVLLSTGHIERFNPAILKVKELLKNPSIFFMSRHTPFRTRGADVSVLHDLMIHDIDLLHWLSGSQIKFVKAATAKKIISATYDIADVCVELENGMQAVISASRVSAMPTRTMRVIGQNLCLDANTGLLEVSLSKPGLLTDLEPMQIEKINLEKTDALAAETEHFVNAVLGKQSLMVTGQDGLNAMYAIEKILHATKDLN